VRARPGAARERPLEDARRVRARVAGCRRFGGRWRPVDKEPFA
jgi:hypothetical protein